MKVYLAATEDLYRDRVKVNVKRLLISYMGTEPRLMTGHAAAGSPEDWCIDSGAHFFLSALFKHNKKPPVAEAEAHLTKYLAFLEALPTKPRFAVELDLQDLYGIEQIDKWREELLFPFQARTGITFAFCWHAVDGLDRWKKNFMDDPRVQYVGFSGLYNMSLENGAQFALQSYEAGKPIHGFACVRERFLKVVPFYSVDSTSWGAGSLFGTVHKFDPKRGTVVGKSAGRGAVRDNSSKAVGNLLSVGGGRVHLRDLLGVKAGGSLSRLYQEAADVHSKFEGFYTSYWRARGVDWDVQLRKHNGQRNVVSSAATTGVP